MLWETTHIFLLKNCSARAVALARGFPKAFSISGGGFYAHKKSHDCSWDFSKKKVESFVPATTYSPPEGVPSVLQGLTSLFGMGRGVTLASNHRNERFDFRFCSGYQLSSLVFRFPNRNGAISTSWLNILLCVHLKPINLIIS
jgi:hypothetical protein